MSLIILSSTQTGVGVQSPEKFSNSLSNTITIPANSEIAVVNCKIYRDPLAVPVADPFMTFIRSNSFTHQSYNFNKGLPSKILWTVPRFANGGGAGGVADVVGALYYQQDNPIYLSLNNVSPIVINDIDIEFVDVDEVPVTDLTGPSVVCLHIRPERR
jgi:hypothetical protein